MTWLQSKIFIQTNLETSPPFTPSQETQDNTQISSLNLLERCENTQASIQGTIQLNDSHITNWKTVSLYLVLEDLFTEKITTLLLNDLTLDQMGTRLTFERRIFPGSYQVYIFIDQDHNQKFNACGASQLGDLWLSNDELISVSDTNDEIDITFTMSRIFCNANESQMILQHPSIDQNTTQSVSPCAMSEAYLQRKEVDRTFSLSQCVPLTDDSTLVLDTLTIGHYDIKTCIGIDTSWDDLPESFISQTTEFERDCIQPQYLIGEAEIYLSQYPQQNVIFPLQASCSCFDHETL